MSNRLRCLSRSRSRSKDNVGPAVLYHLVHDEPRTPPLLSLCQRAGSRQSGAWDYYSSPDPRHTICTLQLLDSSESSVPLPSAPMVRTWTQTLTLMTLLLYNNGLPGRGTISTISMEDEARIVASKLASEELQRKLRDAQETLPRRMDGPARSSNSRT
jgi:hypothetical protein